MTQQHRGAQRLTKAVGITVIAAAMSACSQAASITVREDSVPSTDLAPKPPLWVDNPRVPDFSFAGYHMGGEPIPRLPVVTRAQRFGVVADGVTDDTAAIRRALNGTVDGALLLPVGRIVVRDALLIAKSHIVLRGHGPDKTVLVMPRPLNEKHLDGEAPARTGDPPRRRYLGFVEVRGAIFGRKLADIVAPAAPGSRQLVTRQPIEVKPGEVVRLRMGNADALLRLLLGEVLEPGPQTPKDYRHYVDWAVPVEAVADTRITLARPLRLDVRPEWQAELLAYQPTVEEVGIEDLSFEFPGTPYRPLRWEGYNAIYMLDVANAWVRNVSIVDADSGITLERCRFCQVENVVLRTALRTPPAGHHALWAKKSQDCLFAGFRIESQFDHELSVEAFANGNVFMGGSGQALALDHHRNAPYDNLFTDLDVGRPDRLWHSGGDAERGPHAGIHTTLWNIRHRGHPPPLPGGLHFDQPVDAGWPLMNIVRVVGYSPTSSDANVWIDPAPNAAANLYEAQRKARLGH